VNDTRQMQQAAPYPDALAHLVGCLEYRPGWKFTLTNLDRGQGSQGLTLVITTLGYDSRHPDRGETYKVNHYMLVPPAAYDVRSWRHWLFEQLLLVERHEAMEFFALHDSPGSEHAVRPYSPSHGPGNDPYLVREAGTDLKAAGGALTVACRSLSRQLATELRDRESGGCNGNGSTHSA